MILMYKQFCKNLKNYINLNQGDDYRANLGEELEILLSKEVFNKGKHLNNIKYQNMQNLIKIIANMDDMKLNKFRWELYAYGFDIDYENIIGKEENNRIEENNKENNKDKLELIKLLLGTSYWKE